MVALSTQLDGSLDKTVEAINRQPSIPNAPAKADADERTLVQERSGGRPQWIIIPGWHIIGKGLRWEGGL